MRLELLVTSVSVGLVYVAVDSTGSSYRDRSSSPRRRYLRFFPDAGSRCQEEDGQITH